MSRVQQDFLRRMPEASQHLRRRQSVWNAMHLDPVLLVLLVVLTSAGFFVLFSAGEASIGLLKRQAVYLFIAYMAMFFVAQVKLDYLSRWSMIFYLGGVLLLVAVLFYGVGAKGAQRWLSLGGFRFQPSEMMKLATEKTQEIQSAYELIKQSR